MATISYELTRAEWNYFMQDRTNKALTKNETEFISAVQRGDLDAVALFLENDEVNINCVGRRKKQPITAMQIAAKNNDYHMINLLLNKGAKPITRPSKFKKQRNILDYDKMFETYKALTSPAYLSAANSDPLMTCFDLAKDIKGVTDENYEKVRKKAFQYSLDLLDCCEDMKEVYTLLTGKDIGVLAITLPDKEAIISKAIESCHKEFVAHYKTQKIMKKIWKFGQPSWKEKHTNNCWWLLYVAYCVLMYVALLPVLAIIYIIAPDCTVAKIIDNPKAKYFTKMTSYLLFLVLIIILDVKTDPNVQLNYEVKILLVFLLIYDVAYIWAEVVELMTEGFNKYVMNLWNHLDIIVFMSFGIDILLWIMNSVLDVEDALQVFWINSTALALTLACLRFLEHIYLTNYLGSVLLLFTAMKDDVIKFLVTFVYVVLAFAIGFYYLYEGVPDNAFNLLESSITSLILTIFGGDPTDELNIDATPDYNLPAYANFMFKWTGVLLFTMFGTLCMLMLLNICIAMMSDTYTRMRENIDIEWKFLRTKMWMKYICAPVLPAPYNIIPSAKSFKRLFRCCTKGVTSTELATNTDIELIKVLLARYLLKKKVIREKDIKCSRFINDKVVKTEDITA
ncbi:short transient receptor potential channel 5-like [Saccoglossus kowalevskii]